MPYWVPSQDLQQKISYKPDIITDYRNPQRKKENKMLFMVCIFANY